MLSHRKSKSPEHIAWVNMKARCHSPKSTKFKDYGAKGIKVCDRWRNSFEAFFADMGYRPTAAHSIDRIDNSKGYHPENCRWATDTEQQRNKTNNKMLTIDGELMCLQAAADRFGIKQSTLSRRLSKGLPVEQAISKDRVPRFTMVDNRENNA